MELNIGETIIYQDKGKKKIGLIKSKNLDNSDQIQILSFDHDNDKTDNITDKFQLKYVSFKNILFKANKELNDSFKKKIKMSINKNNQFGGNSQIPGMPTNPDQMPNYTDQMPNYTSQMPNYTDQMPNYTSQMPNYTSQIPNYTSQMPTITSNQMPNSRNVIPVPYLNQLPSYTNVMPHYANVMTVPYIPQTVIPPEGPKYNQLQKKKLQDESNSLRRFAGQANDGETRFPSESDNPTSYLNGSTNSDTIDPTDPTDHNGNNLAGFSTQNFPPKPKIDYNSYKRRDESIGKLDKMNRLDLNPGSIVTFKGEKAKINRIEGKDASIKLINSDKNITVPTSELQSEFELLLNNDPSIDSQKFSNPDHIDQVLKSIKENENSSSGNIPSQSVSNITPQTNLPENYSSNSSNNLPISSQSPLPDTSKKDNIKKELNNYVEKNGDNQDIQDILQGILSSTSSSENTNNLNTPVNNKFMDDPVDIKTISSETTVNKVRRLIRDYERLKEHYNDQHIRFMEICKKITQNKNRLNDFFSLAGTAGQANSQIFGQGGIIPDNSNVIYIDPSDNSHKEGKKISYDDKSETCLIRPNSSPSTTVSVNRNNVFVNVSKLGDAEARRYYEQVLKTITDDLESLHSRIGDQSRDLQQKYEDENKCWNEYQQGGFNLDGVNYSDFKKQEFKKSVQELPTYPNGQQFENMNDSQAFNSNENIFLSTGLSYQIISDDNGIKLIPQTSSPNYKMIEIPREFYNDNIFSRGNQGEEIKIKYIGSIDKFKNICKKIFDQNYNISHDNTLAITALKVFRNDWIKFQRDVDIALEGESKLEKTNSVKPFLDAKGRTHTPRYVYLDNLKQILPSCINDIQTAITEYAESLKNETNQTFQKNIKSLQDNDPSIIKREWVSNPDKNKESKSLFQKLGSFVGIGGDEDNYLEKSNNSNNSIVSQDDKDLINLNTKNLRKVRKETLKKNKINKDNKL